MGLQHLAALPRCAPKRNEGVDKWWSTGQQTWDGGSELLQMISGPMCGSTPVSLPIGFSDHLLGTLAQKGLAAAPAFRGRGRSAAAYDHTRPEQSKIAQNNTQEGMTRSTGDRGCRKPGWPTAAGQRLSHLLRGPGRR